MSEQQAGKSHDAVRITVESLYGMRTDQPLVKLSVEGHEWLLPPAKAQAVAAMLLEAAEASLADAFLIRWVRERVTGDETPPERALQYAAGLVREYRQFRDLQRRAGREQEEADQEEWEERGAPPDH